MKDLRGTVEWTRTDAIVKVAYKYYIPESVPTLDSIIWQQDETYISMIVSALFKYNSPSYIPSAHKYLHILDSVSSTLSHEYFLLEKSSVIIGLMKKGDTLFLQDFFDMIENEKPGTFYDEAMWLEDIYKFVPARREQVKTEMCRLAQLKNNHGEALDALWFILYNFPDEVTPYLVSAIQNSSISSIKSISLDELFKSHYPGLADLLKSRFPVDTALSYTIWKMLYDSFPSPATYKFLSDNIGGEKDPTNQHLFLLDLQNYEPQYPPAGTSAANMLHELSALTDTCRLYNWVGPDGFVNNLKASVTSALSYLAAGDSVNAAVHVQNYKHSIQEVFLDSLQYPGKFVRPGAWCHLYHYSNHVLDSLPALGKNLIIPSSVFSKAHNVVLEIHGTGFDSTIIAFFNSEWCNTRCLSDSVITAIIPDSLLISPGENKIVTKSWRPYRRISDPIPFPVLRNAPLYNISPALTFPNAGSFTIEVKGKGFSPNTRVLWNDSARVTTFVSDSLLRAVILAMDVASVGTYKVNVLCGDSLDIKSDSLLFKVVTKLPKPIRLVEESIVDNRDGTFMACFGYQNVNTESVYIPVGSLNRFTPDNPDRGQNTIFFPGRQKYAFCIQIKEGDTVTWHLLDRAAKVKTNCTGNKKKKSLMK
jgi:hypothetical protein